MIAFPFDSHISGYDDNGYPVYDRASTSQEFALLLGSMLRDGVFGNGMCRVMASSGMTATVSEGGMMIRGRFGYIQSSETVAFERADGRARIDTVVLRRDLSAGVNSIVCAVVKGVSATNPSAPALTRDGTIWELGIADVLIPANSTAISQANITDTRLNTSRCGLVAAILTDIDTTGLYNQIQADLEGFKNAEQANFEEWFKKLQTQLEGDVAANLQSQMTQLSQKVDIIGQNLLIGMARTATLTSSGWSGSGPYTQTLNVSGVSANNALIISPQPSSFEEYVNSKVRATAQTSGSVTFTAAKKPTSNIGVDVMILEGVK